MADVGVNQNGDQWFTDWLDEESLGNYRHLLTISARFVNELVEFGNETFRFCLADAKKDNRRVHLPLLALARHLIVHMDCVCVQLEKGCAEGCPPLLRSMLESLLGIAHITQERSEERALAYQFVSMKKRAKRLRRADRTHDDGRRTESVLSNDMFVPRILSQMPTDLGDRANKIEGKIKADSAFDRVQEEWDRLKRERKKDPEWYALFGGSPSIVELARKLLVPSLYEFSYRDLSETLHAANALDVFGGWDINVIRPLRHPNELGQVLYGVFAFFVIAFQKVAAFYREQMAQSFLVHVQTKMVPKFEHYAAEIRRVVPPWARTE